MSSRMSKYYEEEQVATRYHKNENLYKEISKNELDNYEVKSNTTILGENKNEIDVEKIKKILDTKYNEVPRRKSIRLEDVEEIEEEKEITKEYDINVVLEKARSEKPDNYEEERLKKIRNTQFDILNSLDIKREAKEESEEEKEDNLKNLINTIALNEKNSSSNADLDILSDLRGSGNTEVLVGLKEEIQSAEEKNTVLEEKDDEELEKTKLMDSFYTESNKLSKEDLENFDDFKGIETNNNTLIKVAIAVITIIFLVGVVLLIKTLFFS